MKARERCSGERWVRRARLERCLVKLVTDILNFSREERREQGRQFSCTVRGRQSGGAVPGSSFMMEWSSLAEEESMMRLL